MCNQIARKVFYNQSQTTKVAPVGPDVSSLIYLMVCFQKQKQQQQPKLDCLFLTGYGWKLLYGKFQSHYSELASL